MGGRVLGVESERGGQGSRCVFPLSLGQERDSQVRVGAGILRVEADRFPVSGFGAFEIPGFPEGETQVVLELGAAGDDRGEVLVPVAQRGGAGAALQREQQPEWQEEEAGPAEGVARKEAGEESVGGRARGSGRRPRSAADTEGAAGLRFPDLPDETVEVEVEHGGGGHQREDETLRGLRGHRFGDESDEPVAQHQAQIDQDHRPAPAEERAGHGAGVRGGGAAAVEGPDDGEVLDIMEDLEERHAEDRVGDRDGTPPPEAEGEEGGGEFHRVRAGAAADPPDRADEEQGGNQGQAEVPGGAESDEPFRGEERRAQGVPEFEQFAQAARGMEHAESEPAQAQCQVEAGGPGAAVAGAGVVDAEEAVHLQRAVPDAPEEDHQRNAVQSVQAEPERCGEEERRAEEEPGAEPAEQRPVAVGAQHSRQVVAERAETGDEQADGVGGFPAAGEEAHREDQQRGPDEEQEVGDRAEDPDAGARRGCGGSGHRRGNRPPANLP